MAFHHRKLIADAVNDTLQFCATHCNPTLGVCPPICLTLCHQTCDINHTYLSHSPPPPYFLTTLDDDHDGPVKKSHNVPLSLKLSLAILALSFSLLCSYTIYRCYIRWHRSRHRPRQQESESRDEFLDEDHGPVVDHPIWYIRTVGLNPSIINAITICKYKKSEGLVEGTDCSVCLSEFQEDETLRLLPKCNHAFHIPCIDTWLRSHTNCPLCRAGIVKNPAGSVLPEMIIENSTPGEETQLGVSENNVELSVGIEDEEEEEEEPEPGTKMNEITDGKVGSSDLIQPVRRSVSLDSSAAAMISAAMANNVVGLGTRQSDGISDTRLVKLGKSNMGTVSKRLDVNQSLLRLVGSSSIGRSLQKGPTLMKRSLSSGGKVLLSRHSRSRSRSRSQDVVLRL